MLRGQWQWMYASLSNVCDNRVLEVTSVTVLAMTPDAAALLRPMHQHDKCVSSIA